MKAPSAALLERVTEVVAGCLEQDRSPADVMARAPSLRGASAGARAEVSRWSLRAYGARLRLQRALGPAWPRDRRGQAAALAVAAMVEAGAPPGAWSGRCPPRAELRAALAAITDPLERFAAEHAAPTFLAQRFREAYGDEASALLHALCEPPPRTLRANLLRGDRAALTAELAAEGVEVEPARLASTAVHCVGEHDVFTTEAFRSGWFEQQDEASQLAALACAPPPKGRVLDLCCGSGGKTLALAALLQNRGVVMASDVHALRIQQLRARLARARADNVQPQHLPGARDAVAAFASTADRILVDAPCSGTGSWRRRPQARTSIRAADLASLGETQRRLLADAAAWLRPGARLVYATCSLLPEENEAQVAWLLEQDPGLESVRLVEVLGRRQGAQIADDTGTFLKLRPDRHGCDGFFLAILRRSRFF